MLQVELSEGLHGGDPLDLKNYGIKIYVKFRSDEDFHELSKGTQSGGEKSVTTAVYMMALQGLTQVPFRCVDEINQGQSTFIQPSKSSSKYAILFWIGFIDLSFCERIGWFVFGHKD